MRAGIKTFGVLLLGGALAFGADYGAKLYVRSCLKADLVPVLKVFDARLRALEGVAPVGSQ